MNQPMTKPLVLTLAIAATASIGLAQDAATRPSTAPAAVAVDPDTITIEALPGQIFDTPLDLNRVRGMKAPSMTKMEKAAYLGVGAANPQPALTQQLDLPKGVGLVVEFCEPDSPAAQAGLQQHDVIHKLNDQLLINVHQLATLVRTFNPGEEVTLSIFRKGRPETLRATLVERELPALAALEQTMQIKGLILGAPKLENAMGKWGELEVRPERSKTDVVRARVIRLTPGTSSVISTDGDHDIGFSAAGGTKHLVIMGKQGKVIFKGPYETEEDRTKLPAEFRDKVKRIEDGIEFKAAPRPWPATQPNALTDVFIGGC